MMSVAELTQQARTLDVGAFDELHGPVALLAKPPQEQIMRAAMQLNLAATVAAERGPKLDDLLVMLRAFRTLNVYFLKPAHAPQTFTVGREPGNFVCLDDSSVSKQHASIIWSGTGWRLRDERSTNGSFVNADPVTDHDLKNGDVVSIGHADLIFIQTHTLRSQLLALPPPKK